MNPKLENLLQMREMFAAYDSLMRGDINKELDYLQSVIAENKKTLEQMTQCQGIEKVKAEADAYCEAKRKEADTLVQKANEFKNSLLELESALKSQEDALKLDEEDFAKRVLDFNLTSAEINKDFDRRQSALLPKEQELAEKEKELVVREQKLNDGFSALQMKLDAFKQLAGG